jgi:hypothetical protein
LHRDNEDQAEREEDDEGKGSIAFSPKIDELENLLEAYFVQIDGTLNKVSTVCTLFPLLFRFVSCARLIFVFFQFGPIDDSSTHAKHGVPVQLYLMSVNFI